MRHVRLLFVGVVLAVSMPSYTQAMGGGSQLSQTIKPIECIYTNVETGSGVEVNNTCETQEIPTLETVEMVQRKAVLSGTYPSIRAMSLRVWIGSHWYTLGASPALRVEGDSWYLDLALVNETLTAGTYTIEVEVLTYESVLLRSIYTQALVVPVVNIIQTETEVGQGKTVESRQRSQDGSVRYNVIFMPTETTDESTRPILGRGINRDALDKIGRTDVKDFESSSSQAPLWVVSTMLFIGVMAWAVFGRRG